MLGKCDRCGKNIPMSTTTRTITNHKYKGGHHCSGSGKPPVKDEIRNSVN